MESPERNSMESEKRELELCKTAIRTYFEAYAEFLSLDQKMAEVVIESNLASLESDAKALFESLDGDEELRLPSPTKAGDSKLIRILDPKTRKKEFHVYSSVVNTEEFDKWKMLLNKKFKERGLGLV
jgi:hypothetical protein